MVFNSLKAIVDDIMLTYRDNNISESENLSPALIEQWIHNYRAKLIREDLDKGYDVDSETIQYITLTQEDYKLTQDECGNTTYKIDYGKLPTMIAPHFGSTLLNVKDSEGNIIQIGDETKSKYQSFRKYTCGDAIAYNKNNRLYIDNINHIVDQVEVAAILADPTEAGECFDFENTKYPVSAHLIDVIKRLIFDNELNIMIQMPTDNTNNSLLDVKQNVNAR